MRVSGNIVPNSLSHWKETTVCTFTIHMRCGVDVDHKFNVDANCLAVACVSGYVCYTLFFLSIRIVPSRCGSTPHTNFWRG